MPLQSLIGDLVDGEGVRVGRMVADPEGEKVKSRAIVSDDEFEDHAEATRRRRDVDLEALGKLGFVAVLGVEGPQLGSGDSVGLVSVLGRFGGVAPSRCCPRHVLTEGLWIE